jgi:hypothetical protein
VEAWKSGTLVEAFPSRKAWLSLDTLEEGEECMMVEEVVVGFPSHMEWWCCRQAGADFMLAKCGT